MNNFKIIQEKENKLLNFKEVTATANFEKTPSTEEILTLFTEKYSTPEGACVVRGIQGNFGTSIFTLEVRIYPDKEIREDIENTGKRKKKKGKKK